MMPCGFDHLMANLGERLRGQIFAGFQILVAMMAMILHVKGLNSVFDFRKPGKIFKNQINHPAKQARLHSLRKHCQEMQFFFSL